MATKKTDILNDVLVQIAKLYREANDSSTEYWNQMLQHSYNDTAKYAELVGIQKGINRVYSLICDLWDEAAEERK